MLNVVIVQATVKAEKLISAHQFTCCATTMLTFKVSNSEIYYLVVMNVLARKVNTLAPDGSSALVL